MVQMVLVMPAAMQGRHSHRTVHSLWSCTMRPTARSKLYDSRACGCVHSSGV